MSIKPKVALSALLCWSALVLRANSQTFQGHITANAVADPLGEFNHHNTAGIDHLQRHEYGKAESELQAAYNVGLCHHSVRDVRIALGNLAALYDIQGRHNEYQNTQSLIKLADSALIGQAATSELQPANFRVPQEPLIDPHLEALMLFRHNLDMDTLMAQQGFQREMANLDVQKQREAAESQFNLHRQAFSAQQTMQQQQLSQATEQAQLDAIARNDRDLLYLNQTRAGIATPVMATGSFWAPGPRPSGTNSSGLNIYIQNMAGAWQQNNSLQNASFSK